ILSALIFIAPLTIFNGCARYNATGTPGGLYDMSKCKYIPVDPKIAADKIVVKQHERKMYVYKNGKVIKTIPVSLGKNASEGGKVQAGDFRTPIGSYTITGKRCHPVKYRAMDISYPNAKDIARAKKLGVNPGGLITIHGQPYWNRDGHGDSYTLKYDWTNGCIAVTNKDLDWLFKSVRVGTPIIIEP
ncbi:MAG: L,D-transpeptidase, partial [Epsilonproteobacteria bacterium]|nr:L,D-transpeptidase [Campylobacterota bacterium]